MGEGKTKPGMMLYFSLWEPILELDDATVASLVRATMRYSFDGIDPELDGITNTLWKMIKPGIDADAERYEQKIEKRQYAVYCRGEKAAGCTPVDFDTWRRMTHDDCNFCCDANDIKCNHLISNDITRQPISNTNTITKSNTESNSNTTTTTTTKKEKEKERTSSFLDQDLGTVMSFYMDKINASPSPIIVDDIQHFLSDDNFPPDVITHAMGIAIDERTTKWSYIKGILNRYKRDGLLTLQDVQLAEQKFQQNKERGDNHGTSASNNGKAQSKWVPESDID